MGRPPGESKKKAGRPPKVKPGCLTCKERRIKCDETLPICQKCQRSRRVCKGPWGKTTSLRTLAPRNISPATNMRPMAVTTQCGRSSAEEPPISSSDPENRQRVEPTRVENSIANTVRGHILLEPGASPANTAPGWERGQEQDFIWSEESKGQKEKNIQGSRQKELPGSRGGDYGSPTFRIGMDHSKLPSNPSKQTASEDDLADSANREGSKTACARKRTADAMPLPEARTTVNSKRARRRKNKQQHGDCIVVSMENDDVQTREAGHPNRSPASEASGPALQSDGEDCQYLNEDGNAMQKRLALLAVEASRWTKPTQDDRPPDFESNGVSTHYPTSDSPLLGITENDNTGLSGQGRNPPNDAQPLPPSVSSSHDSQEPSDLHVPASSEGQSSSSVLVETEQDLGRSWNSDRVDSSLQRVSKVEIERRPSMSESFRASSTIPGRSASVDNRSSSLNTYRPETFTNNELRATSRVSDLRPLQSVAPHISPLDFSRAPPHVPSQASTQGIGTKSQPVQPQIMTTSTDPARGNERDNRQAQPHSQSSSCPPALTFLPDDRIESSLPWTMIQPYFEAFSRHGHVLLQAKKMSTENKVYPVGVIMWPQSPDFHRWYMGETGTTDVSTLRFELFDSKLNLEKMFSISRGNAHHFPMLRQYIWDFFWVVSRLNNASTFRVVVRAVQLPSHAFPSECSAASVLPVGRSMTSRERNTGVVADSRPPAAMMSQVHDGYPPYHNQATAHRLSSVTPPALAPKNCATAQMHFPEVKYPGSSSQTQSTNTSMDVAAYVPRQYQTEDDRGLGSRQTPVATLVAPEIAVRVQTDGAGKVSARYSKWVLRPEITTTDFFAWFAHQTSRGGSEGPPSLRFTFKDAMPAPTSSTIAQANEDHFNLMKRDLRTQFAKAKEFVPNLKEFLVVVTDPGWVSEEQYW